jgi:AraC-like DNA-binding protein/effector-binding domain-containing protein
MKTWRDIQPVLAHAAKTLDRNVSLDELARQSGLSRFHLHRSIRQVLGETPKQFNLRLRLDASAAALITTRHSILDIALAFGFESHEAFCRAFQRRFRMTPGAWRRANLSAEPAKAHAAWVRQIGRCVGLYHVDRRLNSSGKSRQLTMNYEITKQQRLTQPVLIVRRRVRRSEIAAAIGAELPKVFVHAQRRGIQIAGFPVTRYIEVSMGLITLETGMRVSGHDAAWTSAQGEGDVIAETLPGGLTAVTLHNGPYDLLPNAYAAIEEWITANGLHARSAPWEAYLNDPTDHPDPADWQTEVCWPAATS